MCGYVYCAYDVYANDFDVYANDLCVYEFDGNVVRAAAARGACVDWVFHLICLRQITADSIGYLVIQKIFPMIKKNPVVSKTTTPVFTPAEEKS